MSESWQDWRDPQFIDFLESFYGMQINTVLRIVANVVNNDAYFKQMSTELTIAVFEKVAPPAVYLKAEYERWRSGTTEAQRSPADVLEGLDETLQGFLEVVTDGEITVVEPRQFIPRASFTEIHNVLQSKGFRYIPRSESKTGKGYWNRRREPQK